MAEQKKHLTLGERWLKDADVLKRGGTLFTLEKPYPGFKPKGDDTGKKSAQHQKLADAQHQKLATALSDKMATLLSRLKKGR